jgi:hypothetical protein
MRDNRTRLSVLGLVAGLALVGWVPAESAENAPYGHRLDELRKQRAHRRDAKAPVGEAASKERLDYIDTMVADVWKENGLSPAAEATAGEFVRRASLDLVGRIPTLEETKASLGVKPNERAKLIDRLLASPEFGSNLANIWVKLLIPDELNDPRDVSRDLLHAWLEREFNRNRPWNEVVHELISATGRWDESPAVNFILANQENGNSTRTTATVTKLFLGVQTQCAECHDHPGKTWTQDQFHGLNAFFVGTREQRATQPSNRQMTDFWTLEDVPFQQVARRGVHFERRNGLSEFTEPKYLDGRDWKALGGVKAGVGEDVAEFLRSQNGQSQPVLLRRQLADVVTSRENPYFARAIVNRVWYQLMGHSFIKDVDDFDNGVDEPTMPELLDKLSDDFLASGYDLKRLYKWIALSKPYAQSSKRKSKNAEDAVGFFSFQLVKPMTPDQLYDSLLTLTEIDRASASANSADERRRFINEINQTFGTEEVPTAAPTYDGTITQSLMLMNSPLIHRVCSCVPGSALHRLVTDKSTNDKERIDAIYLSALSRRPSGAESKLVGAMFAAAKDDGERIATVADVLWAVVNSGEFILNH